MVRKIVRIFVPFAVTEAFSALIVGIAQVLGNGQCATGFDVFEGGVDGENAAVAFVRGGNVQGSFGEGNAGLGPADEFGGLRSGVGEDESHGSGEADRFRGANDESSCAEGRGSSPA